MGQHVTRAAIERFANALAVRLQHPADLYLIGGAALLMAGSPRSTLDVDYFGSDLPDSQDALQTMIRVLSNELMLDVEAVPFQGFVPAVHGAAGRHVLLATFGQLQLWMFDPLAIAVSKLDRGLESDLEDVQFMLRQRLVARAQLAAVLEEVAPQAAKYEFSIKDMRQRLSALRNV